MVHRQLYRKQSKQTLQDTTTPTISHNTTIPQPYFLDQGSARHVGTKGGGWNGKRGKVRKGKGGAEGGREGSRAVYRDRQIGGGNTDW